ncbi:hypothetical protein B0H14DRAFT_3507742 [Mycena olivaceomarginata]|nr:hypothetical protein B0H14DRAFT_3507742 [Mycena olivaceomarginata]
MEARRTTHDARWPSVHTHRKAERPSSTHTDPDTPTPTQEIRRRTHDRRRHPHRPTHPIGNTATYAYTEAAANPTRSLALPHDALPRPSPRRVSLALLHDALPRPFPRRAPSSPLFSPLSPPRPAHTRSLLVRFYVPFSWISFTSSLLSFPLLARLIERFLGSDNVLVWVES